MFSKDEVLPDARARVVRLDFGPPVGFPVQFRVIGPDTAQVREIAYRVRNAVRQSDLVRDTQLDWNEQVRNVQVRVDQDKARLLGLNTADIGGLVQATLAGVPITQIRKGEELVDVVVRATPSERKAIGNLDDLQLATRNGVTVPLSQVARVEPAFEEPVLWRRNRDVTLTVRSDVVDGVQGPTPRRKSGHYWRQLLRAYRQVTVSKKAARSKELTRQTSHCLQYFRLCLQSCCCF